MKDTVQHVRPQGVLDAEVERIIAAMQAIISAAATPDRLAQVRATVAAKVAG